MAPALVPPPPPPPPPLDELSCESEELPVDVLTQFIDAHSLHDCAVIMHVVPDGQSHVGASCGHSLQPEAARANKAMFR